MKLTNTFGLLAVLSCAHQAWAAAEYLEEAPVLAFEPRQVPGQILGTTQNPEQVSPVTTFYMNQPIGTTVTWEGTPYTQTFAAVPDQLPSPIPGQIGWGTLKPAGASKRDAAPGPEETAALPVQGIAGRVRN